MRLFFAAHENPLRVAASVATNYADASRFLAAADTFAAIGSGLTTFVNSVTISFEELARCEADPSTTLAWAVFRRQLGPGVVTAVAVGAGAAVVVASGVVLAPTVGTEVLVTLTAAAVAIGFGKAADIGLNFVFDQMESMGLQFGANVDFSTYSARVAIAGTIGADHIATSHFSDSVCAGLSTDTITRRCLQFSVLATPRAADRRRHKPGPFQGDRPSVLSAAPF